MQDDKSITDDEGAALARTTINLFNAWDLADTEACILLGGMSRRTWARWKAGDVISNREQRMRMAHLMGIHKGLRYLFKEPASGYAWLRKPNEAFGGKSALDIMLPGEMSGYSFLLNSADGSMRSAVRHPLSLNLDYERRIELSVFIIVAAEDCTPPVYRRPGNHKKSCVCP